MRRHLWWPSDVDENDRFALLSREHDTPDKDISLEWGRHPTIDDEVQSPERHFGPISRVVKLNQERLHWDIIMADEGVVAVLARSQTIVWRRKLHHPRRVKDHFVPAEFMQVDVNEFSLTEAVATDVPGGM